MWVCKETRVHKEDWAPGTLSYILFSQVTNSCLHVRLGMFSAGVNCHRSFDFSGAIRVSSGEVSAQGILHHSLFLLY